MVKAAGRGRVFNNKTADAKCSHRHQRKMVPPPLACLSFSRDAEERKIHRSSRKIHLKTLKRFLKYECIERQVKATASVCLCARRRWRLILVVL